MKQVTVVRERGRFCWREVIVSGTLAFLISGAIPPPQEAAPVKDRTLTAATPQRAAHFGYTMAGGKLGELNDTKDDLVVCAMHEDEGALEDVSAIYPFLDAELEPAPGLQRRLLPKQPYNLGIGGIQMGRLEVLVGNPRGPGSTNLILAGASQRKVTYPSAPGQPIDLAGTVEIFDINAIGFDGHAQLSLVAPDNPGVPPTAPTEVQFFGHGLALGDIDDDGIDDVIVGAPNTETEFGSFDDDSFGRVYAFKGHAGFLSNPHLEWVGVNAPQYQESSQPEPDPAQHLGAGFGTALVAVEFDGDDKAEIVVGRADLKERLPAQPAVYKGGSAQILRGSYLDELLANAGTVNTVVDPPGWPAILNTAEPEYQMLLNPFHIQELPADTRDAFGWTLFAIGDIGSADGGPPDGFPDIAVHAEAADFIGSCPTCDCDHPEVSNAGGLFIYFGIDPALPLASQLFVSAAPLLMQRPSNVGQPGTNVRFGRAASGIQLLRVAEGTEPEVQPGLLVAEMNATTTQGEDGGHVMLFRAPLCPLAPQSVCLDVGDPCLLLQRVDVPNAWALPLLQPDEPLQPGLNAVVDAEQRFGSDIVALDYKGDQFAYPGQQFVVSSRQGTVKLIAGDGQTVLEVYRYAGSAFSFLPAGSSP